MLAVYGVVGQSTRWQRQRQRRPCGRTHYECFNAFQSRRIAEMIELAARPENQQGLPGGVALNVSQQRTDRRRINAHAVIQQRRDNGYNITYGIKH